MWVDLAIIEQNICNAISRITKQVRNTAAARNQHNKAQHSMIIIKIKVKHYFNHKKIIIVSC